MPHVGNKGVQRISFQKFFNKITEIFILLQIIYNWYPRMADALQYQCLLSELSCIYAGFRYLLNGTVFLQVFMLCQIHGTASSAA
jgi:hypothetical protein